MSTPTSKPKQTSRWGSLLQGAVAGIESRLDTILAEDAAPARNTRSVDAVRPSTTPKKEVMGARNENSKHGDLSRTPSRSYKGERPLQRYSKSLADPEDLQRATGRASDRSPARTSTNDPTSQTSGTIPDSTSSLTDIKVEQPERSNISKEQFNGTLNSLEAEGGATERSEVSIEATDNAAMPEPEHIEQEQEPFSMSGAHNMVEGIERISTPDTIASKALEDVDSPLKDIPGQPLQTQVATPGSSEQSEEVHSLLERIDALQAKLHYLAQEAADSARRAASEAPRGSVERALADKDTQIALLLQEGEKLSKSEVNQTTMIKRLRMKVADDQKALADTKRSLKRAETSLSSSNEELSRAKAVQRSSNEKLSRFSKLEKEVESLRGDREKRDNTISALKLQLDDALTNADNEASQANAEALVTERKTIVELREELSNLKRDKMMFEEKSKIEIRNNQEELRREQERSRAAEASLRNELSLMESKLEMFRARTEEASSGTTGDAHVKLIRQLETLQTQYAVASENWHGIEGSMQSRMADLEKEKDEAQRQEAETRKKAREANNRLRKLQDELDETTRRSRSLEQDVGKGQAMSESLKSRLSEVEKAFEAEKNKFTQDRKAWDTTLHVRIEEEKVKLRQELGNQTILRTTSPPGARKLSGLEIPSHPARRITSRNASVEPIGPITDVLERPISRRSSNHASRFPEVLPTNGLESDRSIPQLNGSRSRTPSMPGNAPETPSIQTVDYDDPLESRSSPQRTVNDVISGSTVNTGPSVQLVERMSAAVRRLESEKAASKDEIVRLSTQRDEARKEVVSLMREVEEKRAVDNRSAKLEAELADVTRRYQTTLEMLGEKSEQVEELRADVDDLKKIYKDLVERSL